MSEPARWGILGTGLIASMFARDLALSPSNEIHAVGSRRPAGAKDMCDSFGIPKAYDSYEDLVADPDIDLVYIAVPHSAHFAAARLAVMAGKPTLVEKPFTINAAQARHLLEAAAERKVFVMEAMWSRFLPHMVEIRNLVAEGAVGEVRTVLADIGLRFDPAYQEHRLYDPELGGGALLDLGVYAVSFVVSFLSGDLTVRALATKTATGVDREMSAVIRDSAGRHGVITTSLSAELSKRAVIAGTKGRIEIGHPFNGPADYEVITLGDGNPAATSGRSIRSGQITGQGLRLQAEEALRCVRNGWLESPVMPHDLTLRVMDSMDEMRLQTGVAYAADDRIW